MGGNKELFLSAIANAKSPMETQMIIEFLNLQDQKKKQEETRRQFMERVQKTSDTVHRRLFQKCIDEDWAFMKMFLLLPEDNLLNVKKMEDLLTPLPGLSNTLLSPHLTFIS